MAQIGAVIGRGFPYTLIRAAAGLDDPPLQSALVLERLAEADVLLVQALPPDSDYRFKHALMPFNTYELGSDLLLIVAGHEDDGGA